MPRNLPIIFQAAALPEGFTGTPQQFFDAIVERMRAYVQSDYSIFVTGSTAPTSDVGPWLKDGREWRFWNPVTGSYSLSSVPTGTLLDFCGNAAPEGYLLAQGQVVDIAQYPELYSIIGALWNIGGELPTQFRIPDTRGRTLIGLGTGTGLTNRVIAQKIGEENHTLTGAESGQLNFTINQDDGDSQGGSFGSMLQTTLNGVVLNPNINPNAVNNSQTFPNNQTPHNTMQPSLVTCKIIKI